MIKDTIVKLADKKDLSRQDMQGAMTDIMSGKAAIEDIAQFLRLLKEKGERPDEITGAADVMRKFVTRINVKKDVILDTCGTGGDKKGTFNISTISAFVVAGVGIAVAKHGNRSVSSHCGSADLLEALGVDINLSPQQIEKCIEEVGIGFLFAPKLHPAMKYAMPVRKQLGFRTIFNILGPLTNPANATHQILGVFDQNLVEPIAKALKNLGLKHALVIYGLDGLDEITTTANTVACELKNSKLNSFEINPEDFGIKKASLDDLKGADVAVNVEIAKSILQGKSGPKKDIVLLNAGCAIYVADKAKDIVEGIKLAKDSIDSGKAEEKLRLLIEYSKKI